MHILKSFEIGTCLEAIIGSFYDGQFRASPRKASEIHSSSQASNRLYIQNNNDSHFQFYFFHFAMYIFKYIFINGL